MATMSLYPTCHVQSSQPFFTLNLSARRSVLSKVRPAPGPKPPPLSGGLQPVCSGARSSDGAAGAVIGGEHARAPSDDARWTSEEFEIGELYSSEIASTSGRSQEERPRARNRVGARVGSRVGSRAGAVRTEEGDVSPTSGSPRRQTNSTGRQPTGQQEHRGSNGGESDGTRRGRSSQPGRASGQSGKDTWRRQPLSSRPDFSGEFRPETIGFEDEAERRLGLQESVKKGRASEAIQQQPLSRRPDFTAALRSVAAEAEEEEVVAVEAGKGTAVAGQEASNGSSGASIASAKRELGAGSGSAPGGKAAGRASWDLALSGGEGELTETALARWVQAEEAGTAGGEEEEKGVAMEAGGEGEEVLVYEGGPPLAGLMRGAKGGAGFQGSGTRGGEGQGIGGLWEGSGLGEEAGALPGIEMAWRSSSNRRGARGGTTDRKDKSLLSRWQKDADERVQLALRDSQSQEALLAVREMVANGMLPSRENICRLIGQLCKSGSFHLAQKLLQEVEEVGEELGQVHLDERTFGLMIKTALQEEEPLRAAELLEAMIRLDLRPRVATWSAVVARLGRARETAPRALDLFDRLCAKAGTRASPMRPDTGAFNAAMNAAVTAGRLAHAEALLRGTMPQWGVAANHLSCNILLKGYAMAGQPDKMSEMVDMMKASGVLPDVTTYNTLVAAYVGTGALEAAEGVVAEMARLGGALQPGVRTLSILLKGYAQAGRLADAQRLLLEMHAKYGCAPNEVSVSTLLAAQVRLGQMEAARALFAQMGQRGVPASVVTYNTLLTGYCQTDQLSTAKVLFEEMVTAGIKPSVVTFNTLIDGCIRADDNVAALEWFQQMRRAGLHPTAATYTSLIAAFGNSGTPRLAARVFEEMGRDPRVQIDRAAWNSIIHCYARSGLLEEAAAMFGRMKAAGVLPSLPAYGTLIRGYAKAGKAGEALVMWREIKERQAQDQRRLQQREGRARAWVKERRGGEEGELLAPDEPIMDDLVNACVRAGYFARALEIVKEMEQAGIAADRLKYKRLFIELYSDLRRQRRAPIEEDSEEDEVEAAEEEGGRREVRHQGIEAFKFWLGMPNRYYQRDWTWGRHR